MYLSTKHDGLLASTLEPGSYQKTSSLVIVDGFSVEITEDQVPLLSYFQVYKVISMDFFPSFWYIKSNIYFSLIYSFDV